MSMATSFFLYLCNGYYFLLHLHWHLQIDGAPSRSIERYLYNLAVLVMAEEICA